MRHAVLLIFLLTLTPAVRAADAADNPSATILIQGRIWTADKNRPWAEAVAIRDDKIVAVGSLDEVQKLRGGETRFINARDGLVVPGLIDAHIHLIDGGLHLASVQLRD